MIKANVRASALDGWGAVLRAKGYAPDGLEAMKSLPLQETRGSEAMPLRRFVDFSELLVRETRDVSVPWLVGQQHDLALLGPVGEAVAASTTVGSALRRFVDYFELLQDCTDIRLECDSTHASITYRILAPDIWPRHHDAMFSLGVLSQIIRGGAADSWDYVEMLFEATQEHMTGSIDRVVDVPCTFGAGTNMMRFPARLLDCRLNAQPAAAPMVRLNGDLVRKNRSTPLAERLARVIYRDLDRVGIDQERVAREVGMSSRTMRRKLAVEDSSFQEVLDTCRMRQAVFEFQTKPNLSIAQIALRLGYSEHSTFTRAFHRWSGMSPQAFRERLAAHVN